MRWRSGRSWMGAGLRRRRARAALSACRANLAVLTRAGAPARVTVHDAAARPWLERLPEQPRWDLVFLDPPYAMGREELADLLMRVAPRLDAGGVVVGDGPADVVVAAQVGDPRGRCRLGR